MSSLRPRDAPGDHAQRKPNIIFEKQTLTVPKNQAFSEIQTIKSNVVFATPSHLLAGSRIVLLSRLRHD